MLKLLNAHICVEVKESGIYLKNKRCFLLFNIQTLQSLVGRNFRIVSRNVLKYKSFWFGIKK